VNSSRRSAVLTLALLGALALAPGCSTTAPHYAARAGLDRTEREIFGDVAAQEFSKQLQVRLPAKLAVADVTGDTWDGVDRRRLVAAVHGLGEDSDTYSDVVSLGALPRTNDESLRREAAGHQADLELVILRREAVRSETSGLGILNLLILPMFFVPTEKNSVQLTVRAMVRDVRNGLIYTTFDDHVETRVSSTFVGETSDVRDAGDELFAACVTRMRETLARKLATLERTSR